MWSDVYVIIFLYNAWISNPNDGHFKYLMVVFVNYFSRKLKKGIANRKICKKKKKKEVKKQKPPPSLSGVTVAPENGKYCLSPIIWKIWIIQSISSYFLEFPLCVLWHRGGFSLWHHLWNLTMEVQQSDRVQVQIMFSALLVVSLRQVSTLSTPRFLICKKGMTPLFCYDLVFV